MESKEVKNDQDDDGDSQEKSAHHPVTPEWKGFSILVFCCLDTVERS